MKKKEGFKIDIRILVISSLLLISTGSYLAGQSFSQYHIEGSGDDINPKIQLTSTNEHIIFYQSTTSSFGSYDMSILNTNINDQIISKLHFGNNNREITKQIVPFGENFLVAGWLNQYSLIDDYYIAEISPNGTVINEKFWGLEDDDEIQSIAIGNDGKVVCVGNSRSYYIEGVTELTYTKFEPDLTPDSIHVFSTSFDEVPRKIKVYENGDLLIVGFIRDNSGMHPLLMRLMNDGKLKWAKKIESIGVLWDAQILDNDNAICVGELSDENKSINEAYIIKINGDGDVVQSKMFDFGAPSKINQIIKSYDDNYFVVGENANGYFGDYDLFSSNISVDLNINSAYNYGGDDAETNPSVSYMTADSGFTIVGETKSYNSSEKDLLVVNTNNLGESCCSFKLDNLNFVNNPIVLTNVNFSIGSFLFNERVHNVDNGVINLDESLICYSPLEILGKDSLACLNGPEKYSVDIDFSLELTWQVPETATIIENINDTAVIIDFDNISGTIYLTSSCGDTLDSLFVYVKNYLDLDIGNDTILCDFNQLILNPGGGFNSYLWQDGSTDSIYIASESGQYWVRVESECGYEYDTINVDFGSQFEINLGNDTSFCYGNSIILSPGNNYYSYYWQDGSTDSVLIAGNTGYYWVQVTDSIGCTSTDSIHIEAFMDFDFSIGPDTSVICDGDYIFLHGPEGYNYYQWQNGSDLLDMIADTAGIYWLEVTDVNNCAARDSALLIVNKIGEDFLGNDTIICKDMDFQLIAPSFYSLYMWNSGETDSSITINSSGEYWVYVEDSIGCSGIDTINIDLFDSIEIIASDTTACPYDTILLKVPYKNYTYQWNTGQTDSVIEINKGGLYWVEVLTDCGLFYDSVYINQYINPEFDLGDDTLICQGNQVVLSPGEGFKWYLWSNGSTDNSLIIDKQGTYFLDVFDGNCVLSDTIIIEDCNSLYVPNVFTPNNDGYNDYFYAIGDKIDQFKMNIYNRWGVLLKTLNSIDEKWDGTHNNAKCPDGVYYWYAEYNGYGKNGIMIKKTAKGAVSIIGSKD